MRITTMHLDHASRALTALVGVAACAFAAPCWSAGPWLAETGGADSGLAGAGRAALALDAAALASNPAAIGGLPGTTITAAAMPVELDFDFRGSAATPATATNHEGVKVIPALYATSRSDRFSFGLGAYSYLGLSFDLGSQWPGRRVIEQAGLATFNIAPTVAWQATDRLVVGASLAAQLAEPQARLALASDVMFYGPPAGLPDGQLELSGQSWALGGQLGLAYAPTDRLRFGLAWTAPVDHSVRFDVSAKGLHPVLATLLPPDDAARLELTVPQQVLLGLARQLDNGTMAALGLSWQDWSRFGDARLKLPGQSAPMITSGLQDTWGISVGVRRSFGDDWAGSAGVSYESNPATDGGVPVYFPVAEQWQIAAGAERSLSDTLRVRANLSVRLQADAQIVQTTHPLPLPGRPPLTGTFADTRVYMLALAADFTL
jgi:long-chain fatty acid transport protein